MPSLYGPQPPKRDSSRNDARRCVGLSIGAGLQQPKRDEVNIAHAVDRIDAHPLDLIRQQRMAREHDAMRVQLYS